MREVKNAAENQAPREITGGKRKNRLLAKSGRRTWRRNRGTGLVSMGRGIKYGKVGAEAERGSGDGQSWLERPKRGKRRQHATARGWAEWGGRVPLTLVLVRLPLALARRGGLTASAIDPKRLSRCLFLSKPCAVHNLPTSGLQLSHDRISTTPGEGRQLEASTGRNLGQTTSGGLFTGGL